MTPDIKNDNTILELDKKFIRVFDFQYETGKHYFEATRRKKEDLAALKTDDEFRNMLPDAVSCAVILKAGNEEPKLLLAREFRYPAARYLLSPPAGLLDEADRQAPDPVVSAARREIYEETGIVVDDDAEITVINPLLFSSPGMTDESNAIVRLVLTLPDLSSLTQEHAEGSECFDGFVLVTKDEAQKLLKDGKDENGFFYSVYTWIVLMDFVANYEVFR